MTTETKLTNVLYNFQNFCNKINKTNVEFDLFELQDLEDRYTDIIQTTINNLFYPDENIELSKEIINYLVENFEDLHIFFDYSVEEYNKILGVLYSNEEEIKNTIYKSYNLLNLLGDKSITNIILINKNIDETGVNLITQFDYDNETYILESNIINNIHSNFVITDLMENPLSAELENKLTQEILLKDSWLQFDIDENETKFNFVAYEEDGYLSVGIKTNTKIDENFELVDDFDENEAEYVYYMKVMPGESKEFPKYNNLKIESIEMYGWKISTDTGFNENVELDWNSNELNKYLTDYFGNKNQYSGSADWGGISVWSVCGNSDKFVGTFVIIDDNQDVVFLERKFDEDEEENVDNEISTADDWTSLMELLNKVITYNVDENFNEIIIDYNFLRDLFGTKNYKVDILKGLDGTYSINLSTLKKFNIINKDYHEIMEILDENKINYIKDGKFIIIK